MTSPRWPPSPRRSSVNGLGTVSRRSSTGTAVDYTQYNALSHITTLPVWAPAALAWLNGLFAGNQAPNDYAQIPPGNSLAPVHPAGCSCPVFAGSRLAERARRVVADSQHRLAGTQRDLPAPCWPVLGSLHADEPVHPGEVCRAGEVRRPVGRCQVH